MPQRYVLQNPPEPRKLELVVYRRQSVCEVFFFLREVCRLCICVVRERLGALFVCAAEPGSLCWGRGDDVRRGRDWRRAREDARVEHAGVEAHGAKKLGVEADSGVGEEALADHPAQGNACEGVWGVSLDGSTADVFR